MLLKHRDIDVNAELPDRQSILSRLCTKRDTAVYGVKLLLYQSNTVHVYKGSPAYFAACSGRTDILELILKHPNHDVNKICGCCNNRLSIEMISHVRSLDSEKGEALKLIIKSGAVLNQAISFFLRTEHQTPLQYIVLESQDDKRLKTSTSLHEIC